MKNHGSDSIRSAECLFLKHAVIYGYYATYLIVRAHNEIHVHVSTTSGLYDKNEHRSIAIGHLCGSGCFYWLLGTRC